MDLVTVTCLQDRQQMLLQAESVSKYLAPCKVWVIVNETTLDGWGCLADYYTNHDFQLVLAPTWSNCGFADSGWKSQQLVKLYASTLIQDDYLVLDSKNFFVKPCSLDKWQEQLGSGLIEDYTAKYSSWGETIHAYSTQFNVPYTLQHLAMQTPFVINHCVLQSIDITWLLQWFNQQTVKPSEFLLYSILAAQQDISGTLQRQHITLWARDCKSILPKAVKYIENSPNILVAGFHRSFLNGADISLINQWLAELGFSTKL